MRGILRFLAIIMFLLLISGCTMKDNVAPQVAFVDLQNGSKVSGEVLVKVNASDNVGVTKVEIYIDQNMVKELSQAPYEYTWDTNNLTYSSTHTLKAMAYDKAGNVGETPEGIIYLTGAEGGSNKLCAIDSSNLSIKWEYDIGTYAQYITLSDDGVLYFGSLDTNFYAVKVKSSGLLDSPWPKYRGDLKNTGRAK
jgi:hypothetical protein